MGALDHDGFVAALGHVYEGTPALAAAAWAARPFADRDALVRAFHAAAEELAEPDVLALLRAHPQLGASGPMTADSTAEQRAAGLASLEDRARAEIAAGNARYLERFGFPFIIAVRGRGPAEIAAALAERLTHEAGDERAEAFAQVQRIAELRIHQAVDA